jgi:predicted transposase/invertase (TIGR01784 family)
MAVDTLIRFTQDEIEYAHQTSMLKAELDWQDGIAYAERKGRREGHNEGRSEASLDIARNLKGMGMPISQIAKGTGLSTETISQL